MAVRNISQYLLEVDKCVKTLDIHFTLSPWFRGHADKAWSLKPSIFRHKDLIELERDINRDFKLYSRLYLEQTYPKDEFEWLFLMQHYGLPTRLLDWSESALIGLFFAVSEFQDSANGKVWILNPREYNSLILTPHPNPDPNHDNYTVPTASSHFLIDHILEPDSPATGIARKVKADLPVALRPTKNSSRILAQQGFFTIHGQLGECLRDIIPKQPNPKKYKVLESIEIDGRSKKEILKELYRAGVSHSVIFPEITGICKDIRTRYIDFGI
jgi:hypothetical protein